MPSLLNKKEIREIVLEYGDKVNTGRTIEQIIADGDIPMLSEATVRQGKVSDSVFGETLVADDRPIRLMYRTNRISTHNRNRGTIPFKDQVLAINHDKMLGIVEGILGSAQFKIPGLEPTSTVIASENIDMFGFENVLRLYMAESNTETSLYQNYNNGIRDFCGHKLPEGIMPNGRLPYLMDTPSTKEKDDKSVAPSYLFEKGICTPEEYCHIRNASMMAYGSVYEYLTRKGLVLVDTKTEHGRDKKGNIVSADELYTMDSSRIWKIDKDGQLELDENGKPKSYSKEFARGMIINAESQTYSPEQENEIAVRYIEGLQYLTGEPFEPDLRSRDRRIIESTELIMDYLI